MCLQAVRLLPAECPGEEGGTGDHWDPRRAPGGDPRPRGGGPASPLGGAGILGMGAQESLTCRDRFPGTPATPSPLLPASPPLGAFPQQLMSSPVLKTRLYGYFPLPVQMNDATAWRGRGGGPPISKVPLFGSHVIPTDNASHACFLPRK